MSSHFEIKKNNTEIVERKTERVPWVGRNHSTQNVANLCNFNIEKKNNSTQEIRNKPR